METLHPFVVHLPIAMILLWPVVDAVGLLTRRPDVSLTALVLLGLSFPAALAATVSGQSAYDLALEAGVRPEVLNQHADAADLVPWAVLALFVGRLLAPKKIGLRGHWMAVAVGLLLSLFIVSVGRSGGVLVYEHGVGVRSVGQSR